MPTGTKKQSRLTGAIALVGSQAVVLVLGYVTHVWIGRALGPKAYGIYGIVLSVQTIIGLLLTLGVPIAVSRYVARDEKRALAILAQALRIQIFVAAVVSVATLILAHPLATVLDDATLAPYIRLMSLILVCQALYPVYAQFLSGMHRFTQQAALTAVYAVSKLLGAIALLYWFSLQGALAGFAIGGLVAALLGWWWTKTFGVGARTVVPNKTFLSFAGLYVLVLMGIQLLISLDLFMVKAYLHDDTLAGYYNAAVTLARVPFFLLQGLAFVILPSVSLLTKPGASRDRAAIFIGDTLRYLIALIVPGAALAAATSENLIIIFFSRVYLPAAPLLSILMIGVAAAAFYLLLTNIVAGAGKTRVALIVTIGMIATSATLGTILIPRAGLTGAAWQTTVTCLLGLAGLAAYTLKTFRIPVPWISLIRIIFATIIAVSPTYFWSASPLTTPLLYLICASLYIAILIFTGEVRHQDWQLLASVHPVIHRLVHHHVFRA
jgi:O-antigen/teichoic acid export membrane protein